MNVSERTKLLVVEDDGRLRHVLARLLASSSFEATLASSGKEAEAALAQTDFALALVDLGLPDMEGAQLIRRIRARAPRTSVLVLTVLSTEARILEALSAGACGYLYKEDLGSRLVPAIEEALAGGAPMSRDVARMLVEHVRQTYGGVAEPGPHESLTQREREVLELFASGARYEEVARALGMSVNTVRTHTRSIYEKLAVGSKTEAVVVATRLGLLDRDRGPSRTK